MLVLDYFILVTISKKYLSFMFNWFCKVLSIKKWTLIINI